MALHDYLVSEIAVDHADGLLTRREALRRLGLLGLGAAAATSALTGCGSDGSDAATASTSAPAGSAGSAAATSAAVPTTASPATTGGSPTTATSTSGPSTPTSTGAAVTPSQISFAGPAGSIIGSYAAAATAQGAVLLIHENRGLTQHFKDLPGRFAASGYSALAIDLLSRQGGTAGFADEGAVTAALGAAAAGDLVADLRAGLDELARRHPGLGLAAVGFCFGGGQVWSLLNAGEPRLRAAVPCYGPGPASADFSGSPNAAVLGVYAENDARVNASREAMGAALTAAGLTHELRTFPGVDHAFFNDTGARYNEAQATAAYQAMLDWFATHLA